MNTLIRDRITFKTCYLFVMLQAALVVFIVFSTAILPKFESELSAVNRIVAPILALYIWAGYLRYSYIVTEDKFRKVICLVVAIFFIDLALSLMRPGLQGKCSYPSCVSFLSLSDLSYPLLFYGYGLIRNEDAPFFKRLSKLNLYMTIIMLLNTIYLLAKATNNILDSILWVIWVPLLAIFPILFLLIYWEVKLFKHLSEKYDLPFVTQEE